MTNRPLQPVQSRGRAPRQITSGAGGGGGFTLLELLVTISIIVILVGLVIGAGIAVIGGRKSAITQNVLSSLDRALEEYMLENAGQPPVFRPASYAGVPGEDVMPFGNGVGENAPSVDTDTGEVTSETLAFLEYPTGGRVYPKFPDAAVFIGQAAGFGEVDAVVGGLGETFLRPTPTDNVDERVTPSVVDAWATDAWTEQQIEQGSAFRWPLLQQQLIYYVHPQNELAQGLYGRCVNNRPYFFSAGPDQLYGNTNQLTPDGERSGALEPVRGAINALKDNLYSTIVGPALGIDDFRGESNPTVDHPFNQNYR